MKKFTKITLILSVVFMILGMSLMIGTGLLGDLYYGNMDLNVGPVDINLKEVPGFVDEGEAWLEREFGIVQEPDREYQNIRIGGNEVRELDISVKAASLEIIRDDKIDGITIVDGSELLDVYHSVENDELSLRIEKKDKYKSIGSSGDMELTLMIPAHLNFDDLEISLNAANLAADRLSAEELGLNLNASNAAIDVVEAGVLDVDNNAGNLWLYGTVERKLEVDCNAGNVEMQINGSYNDFNYDVDCKVGSIHVDDREYSGLKSAVSLKNEGAQRSMDLDCNAGDVDIQFDE